MWRQGDVLIKKIDKIPEEARRRKGLVLVQGEATGHAHRLTAGKVFEQSFDVYFTLNKPAELIHEEHASISLEPGTYQVVRQREYSPFIPWASETGD